MVHAYKQKATTNKIVNLKVNNDKNLLAEGKGNKLEPFNNNLPQNTQILNNPFILKVQLNQIKHTIKISQNLESFVMDTNYNKRD